MIAASVSGSSSLAPVFVGVLGTIVGGILTASVSVWNMRISRKRDVELEKMRQAQNSLTQRRSERREIYAEWLSGFGRLLDAATSGQLAEYGQSLSGLSHVGDAIQLIASDEVTQAVQAELVALRRIEGRVTDRSEILAEAIRLHENTLALMRADIG